MIIDEIKEFMKPTHISMNKEFPLSALYSVRICNRGYNQIETRFFYCGGACKGDYPQHLKEMLECRRGFNTEYDDILLIFIQSCLYIEELVKNDYQRSNTINITDSVINNSDVSV